MLATIRNPEHTIPLVLRALMMPVALLLLPIGFAFSIADWNSPKKSIYKFCSYTWQGVLGLFSTQWSSLFWLARTVRMHLTDRNSRRKQIGGDR